MPEEKKDEQSGSERGLCQPRPIEPKGNDHAWVQYDVSGDDLPETLMQLRQHASYEEADYVRSALTSFYKKNKLDRRVKVRLRGNGTFDVCVYKKNETKKTAAKAA